MKVLVELLIGFCQGFSLGVAYSYGVYLACKTCSNIGIINYSFRKYAIINALIPIIVFSGIYAYKFTNKVGYNYLYKMKLKSIKNIMKKQLNQKLLISYPYPKGNDYDINYSARNAEYGRNYNILFPDTLFKFGIFGPNKLLPLRGVNYSASFCTQGLLIKYYAIIEENYFRASETNKCKYLENFIDTCEQLSDKMFNWIETIPKHIIEKNERNDQINIFMLEYLKKTLSRQSFVSKYTILSFALFYRSTNIDKLIVIFFRKQKNFNELIKSNYYSNPLYLFVNFSRYSYNDSLKYMKLLINFGIDINLADAFFKTIIFDVHYINFIKLCLINGIDLEKKSFQNKTALTTMLSHYERSGRMNNDKMNKIKFMIDYGAKIDNYLEKYPTQIIDPRVKEYSDKITPTQVWKNKVLLSICN